MQPQPPEGEASIGAFVDTALNIVGQLMQSIRQNHSPETVLGSLSDAALITSSNGQVLYANGKHTEWFTAGESPVGKTATAYLPEELMATSRLADAMLSSHCQFVVKRQYAHNPQSQLSEYLTLSHSLADAEHPSFRALSLARLLRVLSEPAVPGLSSLSSQWQRYQTLGETDRVMARYLAQGYSPREVAGILNVSPRQVELRRKGILTHFNLPSATQLTILFVRFQDRGYLDFGL